MLSALSPDLEGTDIRDQGAGRLAGVLAHCPALSASELYLNGNQIGDPGAGRSDSVASN